MTLLPDLCSLSHAEKNAIIDMLFESVQALRQDVAVLLAENKALKAEVDQLHGQKF